MFRIQMFALEIWALLRTECTAARPALVVVGEQDAKIMTSSLHNHDVLDGLFHYNINIYTHEKHATLAYRNHIAAL